MTSTQTRPIAAWDEETWAYWEDQRGMGDLDEDPMLITVPADSSVEQITQIIKEKMKCS